MIHVTIREFDGDAVRYYAATLTVGQAERHNNYALVSCGLNVGLSGQVRPMSEWGPRLAGPYDHGDLRRSTLRRWIKAGIARPISWVEWNR